jgi:hypothetical protein
MFRNSRVSSEHSGDNSDPGSDVENKYKASPASRLRAAMNRLGHSSPPRRRAPLVSESDSDLNPVFSARKSLKDVFSRAMRDTKDSPEAQSQNGGIDQQEDTEDGAMRMANFQPRFVHIADRNDVNQFQIVACHCHHKQHPYNFLNNDLTSQRCPRGSRHPDQPPSYLHRVSSLIQGSS